MKRYLCRKTRFNLNVVVLRYDEVVALFFYVRISYLLSNDSRNTSPRAEFMGTRSNVFVRNRVCVCSFLAPFDLCVRAKGACVVRTCAVRSCCDIKF